LKEIVKSGRFARTVKLPLEATVCVGHAGTACLRTVIPGLNYEGVQENVPGKSRDMRRVGLWLRSFIDRQIGPNLPGWGAAVLRPYKFGNA